MCCLDQLFKKMLRSLNIFTLCATIHAKHMYHYIKWEWTQCNILFLNMIFSQLTRFPSCVCVNTMYIYQYSVKHLNQELYQMQSESFITWIPPKKKKTIGILQVNKKSVCTVFTVCTFFHFVLRILCKHVLVNGSVDFHKAFRFGRF